MNIVSVAEWLSALAEPAQCLELNACRFHLREKGFVSKRMGMAENQVVFVEAGQLEVQFVDASVHLSPGDVLWMRPGLVRTLCGGGVSRVRHHNLRFGLRSDREQLTPTASYVLRHDAWEIMGLMPLLYDIERHGHRFASTRLRALVLLLSTTVLGEQPDVSADGLRADQRLRIDRLVAEQLSGVSPEDMAQEAGLSLDYFTRRFRRTYGMAPRYYLKRERMRLAAIQLTESTMTVAEVAHAIGTDNVSLFCRQFRSIHGCTPTAYRRRGVGPMA